MSPRAAPSKAATVKLDDVLDRARAILQAAESMQGAPGAAGLAYQAADLASKVLLVRTDGADIWAHAAKEQRLSELLPVDAADLRFLHKIRQLDFYADQSAGAQFTLPTQTQIQRALTIARQVVDAIDFRLTGRRSAPATPKGKEPRATRKSGVRRRDSP